MSSRKFEHGSFVIIMDTSDLEIRVILIATYSMYNVKKTHLRKPVPYVLKAFRDPSLSVARVRGESTCPLL